MPNTICDKCGDVHETYQHDLHKLTAHEFYQKYYFDKDGYIVCHNITDWLKFAEAYARAKQNGVPDIPAFVSHKEKG